MRALYLSHTGLSEPLGRSQIVPYLRGLSRCGWRIDVVGFEPSTADELEIARLSEELAGDRIQYSWTRRSASHALGTKVLESAKAFAAAALRALAFRPQIVHARSYLPAAVAKATAALSPGSRFIFDCRGLLGDEYVDSGHWARGSFRHRLIKVFERQLFSRAHGIVTLTDRLKHWLIDEVHLVDASKPLEVIPCCVDLERFRYDPESRARSRARLGAGDRFVLAYSGTLGSYYCEEEMAKLFASLRKLRPALFAVFTRSSTDKLRAALRRENVPDEEVAVQPTPPTQMPAMLCGADAGVSFIEPWFSKIASSPVKVAEYLATGVPVAVNRGIGDQDHLIDGDATFIDGGTMTAADLSRTAARLAALDLNDARRTLVRKAARDNFCLETIGIARYRRLYERLAG
jgi:glycosyltransferase involved in cell wall biosynthesis